VVASRDVLLGAELVLLGDDALVERRESRQVVDDAGVGVVGDVIDVGLVERPRVELALGSVLGVVDRAVVEPERLGLAVRLARGEPRLLRRLLRLRGRIRDERVEVFSCCARVSDSPYVARTTATCCSIVGAASSRLSSSPPPQATSPSVMKMRSVFIFIELHPALAVAQ
jgi:hypothetical protein